MARLAVISESHPITRRTAGLSVEQRRRFWQAWDVVEIVDDFVSLGLKTEANRVHWIIELPGVPRSLLLSLLERIEADDPRPEPRYNGRKIFAGKRARGLDGDAIKAILTSEQIATLESGQPIAIEVTAQNLLTMVRNR